MSLLLYLMRLDLIASFKYLKGPTSLKGFWSFVWGFFRLIREFFTDMETSPLPVKGCKFIKFIYKAILGTYGH